MTDSFPLTNKMLLLGVIVILAIVMLVSARTGVLGIEWANIFDTRSMDYYIFWQIRFPRILSALCIGGALAICGTIMQGLFRNPLVEPGIVGVSSGAALFAALGIVMGQTWFPLFFEKTGTYGLPIIACFGGLVVTSILYFFSCHNQSVSTSALLLIGIAINAFAGAIIGLLTFIASDVELRALTFWTMGRLSELNYEKLMIIMTLQLILIPFILIKAKAMNAMLLGEREAKHLGVNVERLKKQQIWAVAILTGSAVAFTGAIGFIGLVVPHLIRLVFGSNHRIVLPLSYVLGGMLLLMADNFARTLAAPAEMPVGIFTAFIGAPFLAYLVYRQSSAR